MPPYRTAQDMESNDAMNVEYDKTMYPACYSLQSGQNHPPGGPPRNALFLVHTHGFDGG